MGPTPSPALPSRLERLLLVLLALCLLGTALFFYTPAHDQFELPKQALLRALSSLLLGLLLALKLRDPAAGWRRGPLDLPVLAWSAWLLVCTVGSVAPWVSWRGEYENFAGSLTQLNYAALYFATVQIVRRREDAVLLLRCVLAGALGAALYALLQAQQRDLVQWAAASVISDRFFGPLGNPNFLGGLIAMAIPLKLALAWGQAREGAGSADPDRWTRWALLGLWVLAYSALGRGGQLLFWNAKAGSQLSAQILLGLWLLGLPAAPLLRRAGRHQAAAWLGQGLDLLVLLQALANTGTRGAVLGLLLGLAVLALGWMGGQERRLRDLANLRSLATLGLLGLLLIGAFMGLGSSFRQRVAASLRNPAQALDQSRLQIWVPALAIWKDHPIAGTGVDTFKTVFPRYSLSRFNRYDGENVSSRMAHCEPLQVASTQGTVGLLLWAWLCGAFFLAWWRRLRQGGPAEAWWLGLGALMAAYLGQNLVSFGVAGISTAFWIGLALPAWDSPARRTLPWRPWARSAAYGLAGLLTAAGLWALSWTVRADLRYAYAGQAQDQLQALDQAGFQDLRGVAAYCYQSLAQAPLNADNAAEFNLWQEALRQQERQGEPDAAAQPALAPFYRRAAGALLMLEAARAMETAVALCPQEVKYHVYLGLAYEELFRRTQPERRGLWFRKAAESYERSVALNPGNAYYRGNLGRLYSMAAEAGDQAFYGPAAAAYLEALDRAPVTRLFYENLLLLYARNADLEPAGKVLDALEARDKELAPGLLIAAASTFFQWRASGLPAWTPAKRQAAAVAALDWGRRAQALKPSGDQALALAIFAQALGQRQEMRRWAAEALRLKPKDAALAQLVKDKGLAR